MVEFKKSNAPAVRDFKLCANYETMFSDTRARVKKKTPACKASTPGGVMRATPKSFQDLKELMEVQGSHGALFYRQPSGKRACATVVVDLDGSKKVSFGSEDDLDTVKPAMMIALPVTRGTQTDYRESEAQTLPWKHEVKAKGKILAELTALDWLCLDTTFPLKMEEIIGIEKCREKLAWENILSRLRGKENEGRRNALVSRMTAAETAFREEKLEDTHRERLALSRERMREARERFEEELMVRLQRSYGVRRKENDEKMDYWKHQMSRKLRKMKSARNPPPRRGDIVALHVDRTSDIYAPKMRDGENPARGHEVINIQCRYLKRFHGLEILEKYIADILKPQFFKAHCRFPSKPKKPKLCPRKFKGRAIPEPDEGKFDGSMFKVRVLPPATTPEDNPLPRVTRSRTDSEEDLYQASLLLGRIIKGRAIQSQKFLEYFKMATE